MKAFAFAVVSIMAAAACVTAGLVAQSAGPGSGASSRPAVTAAQYEQWKKDLSNWGRWGKDD